MNQDKTGMTAYNRPHQSLIHYSAKGYDEYRADLIRRFADKCFVFKNDGFLNAFIDLTAYLAEILSTYNNAYAHEIYLETAQLRESLFSFAAMVDYRIDPGAAAVGTLVVMAKPDKSGLLPRATLITGKEEGAKKKVSFETDADLLVDEKFNNFVLDHSERFNDVFVDVSSATITVTKKIIVRPGQYIFFEGDLLNLFGQVQSSTVNKENRTTEVSFTVKHPANPDNFAAGSGTWKLISNESRGLLKLTSTDVWLDNKYENIAVGSPIVLRDDLGGKYGVVTALNFETLPVKTGAYTRISETDNPGEGESRTSEYTVYLTASETKTFYVIQKTIIESREVTKLTVTWSSTAPAAEAYPEFELPDGTLYTEKSSVHLVFVGAHALGDVMKESVNLASLNGSSELQIAGDFSAMEKHRTLILHQVIDGMPIIEKVNLLRKVEVNNSGSNCISIISLESPIKEDFTKGGVEIWGNVVRATQGKTVKESVLGSGRGDLAYQAFDLPRSPLTNQMRGDEGIRGAIDIMVSGIPWYRQDDFLDSGPEDHHYIVETDFSGKSRVVFGDGLNGSRLPTGKDNVVATFRVGQGKTGNVSAGVLKKPASKPPFFKEVFNPYKTDGGSDPDTDGELRENIPVQHLTFDRAVSLQDYGDLALSFPSIAKAKAGWRWKNNKDYVYLVVVGQDGQEILQEKKDELRGFLDTRRDINQPLIIDRVNIVTITLFIHIVFTQGFDPKKVEDNIDQALGTGLNEDGTYAFFNFERLELGMGIHKKDIYKVLENIPGVELITCLVIEGSRMEGDSEYYTPSSCSDDVWINNWELAKLDEVRVFPQPPVDKLCESSGG